MSNEQIRIFVPVSHNGGGDGKTGWAISLATAFIGQYVNIVEMGGSHADRACNNMANAFLRTDCDVMLIIDIDTIFTQHDVERIIGHIQRGHKCVWGLYPKKQDDGTPCVNTWPKVGPADEHGLVDVRRAGRGFLAVTRDVFERLKQDNGGPAVRYHNHEQIEWAFFHSGVVEGKQSAIVGAELHPKPKDKDGFTMREWISEDWMFCEDIRHWLGIPTLVDTGIVLAHVGEKVYRFPPDRLTRVDSKITTWKEIHGWFDYEDFYRYLVAQLPHGGMFVEVGSWMGRSIAAFCTFADEAGKIIVPSVVDSFKGRPENDIHAALLEAHGGSVRKVFDANLAALGLRSRVEVIESDSAAAADQFPNGYVDAVFIDAGHGYESVCRDIAAWLPKVKPRGIISGHDYDETGVKKAVDEVFGENVKTMGRCWFVRL